MFSLESGSRYFMCQHPVNMRKGIDSLFSLIQSESPLSPMSSDVFVFFSKNRQLVKIFRWDTDGYPPKSSMCKALFYSLSCSCRLCGIDFFEYLTDVINRVAAMGARATESTCRDLLPDKWEKKQ